MKWTHGMRARLGLLRRGAAEARMDDEIRFHIEMETEKNVRAGMSPEEARRRAVLAFGGVEAHKEELREGRTLGWAGGVSLDVKLGVRMLRKYPGLTLVATLALAVAIALGSLYFEALNKWQNPRLPIADPDRVVSIRLWDVKAF